MMKNKKEMNLISEERRTRDLQSAARAVMPLAKSLLGKNGFLEIDLLSGWREIVGDDVAAYSLPKQLIRGGNKGGCLLVEVPSGAFALELQLKEKNLVARINAFFGNSVVSHIKVIQNAQIPISENEDVRNAQKILVTAEEETYIEEISKDLISKDLKKKLADLGKLVFCANREVTKDEIRKNY